MLEVERPENFLADVIRQRRLECDRPPLKVITQRQETHHVEPGLTSDDSLGEICQTTARGDRGHFVSEHKQSQNRSLNLLYTKSAPVHKIRPLQRGDL